MAEVKLKFKVGDKVKINFSLVDGFTDMDHETRQDWVANFGMFDETGRRTLWTVGWVEGMNGRNGHVGTILSANRPYGYHIVVDGFYYWWPECVLEYATKKKETEVMKITANYIKLKNSTVARKVIDFSDSGGAWTLNGSFYNSNEFIHLNTQDINIGDKISCVSNINRIRSTVVPFSGVEEVVKIVTGSNGQRWVSIDDGTCIPYELVYVVDHFVIGPDFFVKKLPKLFIESSIFDVSIVHVVNDKMFITQDTFRPKSIEGFTLRKMTDPHAGSWENITPFAQSKNLDDLISFAANYKME